jgi:hypothetical protein
MLQRRPTAELKDGESGVSILKGERILIFRVRDWM